MSAPDPINIPTFRAYPTLRDLLPTGGKPGLEYALIFAGNLTDYAALGFTQQSSPFIVEYEGRQAPSVVLVARGEPVLGGDPMNGERLFQVDSRIDEALDYVAPEEPTPEAPTP